MAKHSTCKIVSLCISGVIFIVIGVLLGRNFITRMIQKKILQKKCIDSIKHESYEGFVGDVSKRKDNRLIKIFHWNLTNKHDFLFNGATPTFEEVGPYIYKFASEKLNVDFLKDTIRYQTAMQIEYDDTLTRVYCVTCKRDDKFNTVNLGYLGLVKQYGGDTNLAYGLVPGLTASLLTSAYQNNGNQSNTMKKIGKYNDHVLPTNTLPFDFKIDFSSFLADVIKYNTSMIDFSEQEMSALYHVITNSTLLGVAAPPPPSCAADPSADACLQTGFLNLVNWLGVLQTDLVTAGKDPLADPNFLKLYGAIVAMFCPNTHTQCFDLSKYQNMMNYIAVYVTQYLAKLAMHQIIDSPDYSVITTRTHSDIVSGYSLSQLRFPGYDNGISVPGLINNDIDLQEARRTKPYVEIYKCDVQSQNEGSWAKYDGNKYTPSWIFKNASQDFLRITGRYTNSYFGLKKNIEVCRSKQAPNQDSYDVYDALLRTSYIIRQKEAVEFHKIPVHKFETDLDELYSVNNVSVFTKGLIDLSATKNGVPFFVSAPYFYKGDGKLSQNLNMKPNIEKHKTYFYIEPYTGATLNVKHRIQINTQIVDSDVSAPRLVPYTMTYKDGDGDKISKPFPIVWIEYNVFATDKDLETFTTLFNAMKGSCAAIVVGPLVGVLFIMAAAYFYWKKIKGTSAVDDSREMGKSSTSM